MLQFVPSAVFLYFHSVWFTHFCPSGLHGRHLTHTQSSHFLSMQLFGHSMLEALSVGYFIELSAAIWPFIHFPPTSQPFILHIDVFMGKSVSSCRVSDKQVGHWKSASAGNRTRVTSMATMYSTTRPLMLMSHLNVGWNSFDLRLILQGYITRGAPQHLIV
jgi:hypothetical protein